MAEISPDIAGKVLSADLRNTVKKVSDGGTLSTDERERMEKFLVGEASADDLQRVRRAALLRKWVLGGRLTEEELEEVSGFLPNALVVEGRKTREAYLHPLPHYAPIYGVDKRNLKRWKKIGASRNDLPPLDEPEKMAAWWSRNMKWRIPEKLLGMAVGGASIAATAPPADGRPAAPPAQGGEPGSRRVIEMSEGSSYSDRLKRAVDAERVAHAMYMEALQDKDADEGKIELRFRAFSRAQETARKMEISGQEVMKNDAAWVRVEDYEREDDEIKNTLCQSLRSLMVRVATKVGLPAEWFQKVNNAFQGELDHCFEQLAESDYAAPVEPFELAAA